MVGIFLGKSNVLLKPVLGLGRRCALGRSILSFNLDSLALVRGKFAGGVGIRGFRKRRGRRRRPLPDGLFGSGGGLGLELVSLQLAKVDFLDEVGCTRERPVKKPKLAPS